VQLRHLQHQRRYWLVSSRALQHSSPSKLVTWRSLSDRPLPTVLSQSVMRSARASRETPHTSYRVLPSKSSARIVSQSTNHQCRIGEYLPLQGGGRKELKEVWASALPLSRRGSRSQSLGKRRTLFGRIGSGGVWRRARKWRTWNPA
jgi:hypothetical protein